MTIRCNLLQRFRSASFSLHLHYCNAQHSLEQHTLKLFSRSAAQLSIRHDILESGITYNNFDTNSRRLKPALQFFRYSRWGKSHVSYITLCELYVTLVPKGGGFLSHFQQVGTFDAVFTERQGARVEL